jgi:hypothetical protein
MSQAAVIYVCMMFLLFAFCRLGEELTQQVSSLWLFVNTVAPHKRKLQRRRWPHAWPTVGASPVTVAHAMHLTLAVKGTQ